MTDPALSARNKRNKRKGADFEIALEKGLREELDADIERLRLKGVEDEGDLVIRDPDGGFLIIEAKDAAFQPGTFIGEAEREALNYAMHRNINPDLVEKVVIVKRRGKNWRKAFVLTTVEDFFGLDDEA